MGTELVPILLDAHDPIEYASWADVGELTGKLDAASRDVLGRPFTEVVEQFNQMRDPSDTELYIAPPGGM